MSEEKIIEERQSHAKQVFGLAIKNIAENIQSNPYYGYIENNVKFLNENYLPADNPILLNNYGFSFRGELVEIVFDFFLDDIEQRGNPFRIVNLFGKNKDTFLAIQIADAIRKANKYQDKVSWDNFLNKKIYYGTGLYNPNEYMNYYQYLALIHDVENIALQNTDAVVQSIMLSFNLISSRMIFDIQ